MDNKTNYEQWYCYKCSRIHCTNLNCGYCVYNECKKELSQEFIDYNNQDVDILEKSLERFNKWKK